MAVRHCNGAVPNTVIARNGAWQSISSPTNDRALLTALQHGVGAQPRNACTQIATNARFRDSARRRDFGIADPLAALITRPGAD
jgi:hypothetical protein